MPLPSPTYSAIQARIEQDVVNSTGVNLPNTSTVRYFSRAQAKELYLIWGFLQYVSLQSIPGTSTDVYLEEWASLKGITRKPASFAIGTITFTGTAGTSIPAGTVIQRSDGFTYTTDVLSNVGSPVAITATASGSQGNTAAGTTLSLASPIAGVQSQATLTSAITSGADMETDDSLRVRMKDAFSIRSIGGSAQDHVDWALAVPGVNQAWCATTPIKSGQVMLYVMGDRTNQFQGYPQGTNGAATGEPRYTTATGDQLTVANALDSEKPVGEILVVCSPVNTSIAFSITGLSSATASVQSAVKTAISDLFHLEGTPLGTYISNASIINTISAAAGTTSFSLLSPSGDISLVIGQLPEVGTIAWN
ncbi:baseplate J/gp47 family protein [Gluconacetobacter sp. 1b LMG 1731]|uniref:Baseplate J/gp47 family protein n=1 Tax=Gluconacetobacter dulcium TaxID=2729096 RepID=A0A7W4IJK9_9PROT|nr:baseplate J/gp47 family protein [Gluconacetobacter dulcium]MBB2164041.1 baseplate J/gp47 family protein [Gluconacetobacter dulcium]MBB2192745.1 baseplate J/gp47 family protein [Gluconacetobacter dulcium]